MKKRKTPPLDPNSTASKAALKLAADELARLETAKAEKAAAKAARPKRPAKRLERIYAATHKKSR